MTRDRYRQELDRLLGAAPAAGWYGRFRPSFHRECVVALAPDGALRVVSPTVSIRAWANRGANFPPIAWAEPPIATEEIALRARAGGRARTRSRGCAAT